MPISRTWSIRILCCWLIAGSFFMTLRPAACAEGDATVAESASPAEPLPTLAEMVYQSGTLSQQLATLKTRTADINSLQKLDQQLDQAKLRVEQFDSRLTAMNADDLQSYQQLASIKSDIRGTRETVARLAATLAENINPVETWRRQWLDRKKKWAQWHAQLGDDLALESVASAFARATAEIDEALNLVTRKLEPMLAIQQKIGDINARIDSQRERIDAMMAQQRGDALRGGTPTIFSRDYLRQLIDLSHEPGKIAKPMAFTEKGFFADKAWVIVLQVVVFALLLGRLRRHGPELINQANRRFLGKRPVSVALLVPIFAFTFLYGTPPPLWRMLILSLAGVATARLMTHFVAERWIRRAIYILVTVMILFQGLLILGIPLALVRLFILVWTGAGVAYFGWRVRKEIAGEKPGWQVWALRLVTLMFTIILVTDIIGFSGFATQLMDGAMRTAMLLLMGWAMIHLTRTGLEIGMESLPMGSFRFLRNNANEILARLIFISNAVIIFFVVANLLVAWKLYAIPADAVQAVLSFGLSMGGHHITLGLVLVAGMILYGAFVLSWSLQGVLMENVLSRGHMDTGARLSIVRLVHYALILIGFLIALSAMGFELQNITIIGGALGVGIGFGMQNIVNNFVSGLILLFERPIKVGDVVQLGDGQQGRVTNLGLRATTVQTFDRAEIVVPNGDLISSQVTNWTLGDRSMRLTIPVGVAYGSDVETVTWVLMAVATESDKVLKDPQPMVLFLNFGDSSLDFQLRVWIADFNERRIIQSALIREIDRRFRIEGVEIPFPQRDLHLRSVDDTAADRLNSKEAPCPPAAVPESE
ncbi:hypothetical protein DSCO28_41260 [Desulfosarcina ovata subsp. sediminis]|uniref:Mechanosensitive ion channel protein MscS n=1 Tax=Desulfosarcina ovata subsp. sediminis TaxID=885957 RepID=A0A5K7ZTN9_9BACT|nr:mechanosensitive ion channel domain-containing protein [Desulfosarcina ovata]BBO83560.1 hypothetical protein DSCO28_41260 [Desulfosarcina ovata subsp. sediminis]